MGLARPQPSRSPSTAPTRQAQTWAGGSGAGSSSRKERAPTSQASVGLSGHLHVPPTSVGTSSSWPCHLPSHPLRAPGSRGPRARGWRPGLTRLLLRGQQHSRGHTALGLPEGAPEDIAHQTYGHRNVGLGSSASPRAFRQLP